MGDQETPNQSERVNRNGPSFRSTRGRCPAQCESVMPTRAAWSVMPILAGKPVPAAAQQEAPPAGPEVMAAWRTALPAPCCRVGL